MIIWRFNKIPNTSLFSYLKRSFMNYKLPYFKYFECLVFGIFFSAPQKSSVRLRHRRYFLTALKTIAVFLLISGKLSAQVTPFFDRFPVIDSLNDGFSIHGHSLVYFKNNEYIKEAYPGFSALGANNELSVSYKKQGHSFTGGIFYQFVFGRPLRSVVLPILSYQYKLTKDLKVVLGTLEGPAEHRLSQELQGVDAYLANPIEYGAQFKFTPKWLDADVWINWRENIITGDSAQEKFTQGSNFNFHLLDKNDWKIDANATALFYHFGGQIDISEAHVVSLINYGLGISVSKKAGIWNNTLSYNYSGFKNDEDYTLVPWDKGFGHSLTLDVDNNTWYFGVGYRKFDRYFTLFGDQVFSLINQFTGEIFGTKKELISGSISYQLLGDKNFNINIGSELYYNLPTSQLDYNYSVMGRFKF